MAPPSAVQKAAVASFVSITGASEKIASRYLKNTGFKLNEAVDAYFQANVGPSGPNKDVQLGKLFDSLRNDGEDQTDILGADSSMQYLNSIGVDLEGASLFLAMELVQAPTIGEITRDGFIKGWSAQGVDTKVEAQKQYFKRQVSTLSTDRDLFRRVYRYAFVVGKEGDQRALSLDNSIVYWEMLFKKPGQVWVGSIAGIDWLGEWITFLREKWTRSVSRDMWNQTFEFAMKSIQDETLSFWSEDGAWPGVIDQFVAWYRQKSEMDVDA
ncbi:Cullin binding-domain-containing protein [Annulohypoxylon maeteangense]|uniref:Cullin binding-domain-containing protein n=1 Tax=Annulohypoxylon maeteangense TaxID=1927788 RepID=UPI0020079F53|nr:Cullin binding-domain-containing protein [Annulohypoxylon maeteangense]KAI0880793.1 Cullin binding-domain-containing protein [Annulohypoxylon maeteangense]